MYDTLKCSGEDEARKISAGKRLSWEVNICCSSSALLSLQDLHLENARTKFCWQSCEEYFL
jgi:hypothetical protein